MSYSAIICLLIVWTFIASGTFFCFYKLMTSKRSFDSNDE